MDTTTFPKKVGIYSGSFNPIHIGHLALANWLCEYTPLDEIWFLVTPQNPFKSETELMNDEFRLELVQYAIADYPKFKASDFEFHLPKPSYTIDTLHTLSNTCTDCLFHLIIGSDNWMKFAYWKDSEKLLAEYPIIIYPRKGFPIDKKAIKHPHIYIANAPEMEISSTFIRQALAQKKDIRFFLPKGIWNFLIK